MASAAIIREPDGRLAQLGEHLVYTQRVGGSIPSPPTILTRSFEANGVRLMCRPESAADALNDPIKFSRRETVSALLVSDLMAVEDCVAVHGLQLSPYCRRDLAFADGGGMASHIPFCVR